MDTIPTPPVAVDEQYHSQSGAISTYIFRDQDVNEDSDLGTVYFTILHDTEVGTGSPIPAQSDVATPLLEHIHTVHVFTSHPTDGETGSRVRITSYTHGELSYQNGYRSVAAHDVGTIRYVSEVLILPPKDEVTEVLKTANHNGTLEFVFTDDQGRVLAYEHLRSADGFSTVKAHPRHIPFIAITPLP